MKFSVIIPARNEAVNLGTCLDAVAAAARHYPGQVEVLVVLNRCTDDTESIARACGARIVRDDSKNLSKIRNAGARAAAGDILITVDADSIMAPNTLTAVDHALASGRFIGGGVLIKPERWSLGIVVSSLFLLLFILPIGISGGLFWCYRRDFEAIGGFNESMVAAEDIDFARRMKAHGRRRHRRWGTLWRSPIVTSCRKFDRFGDWFVLRHIPEALQLLRGKNQAAANVLFYDFKR